MSDGKVTKDMKESIMKIVKNIYAEPIAKVAYGEIMNIEKGVPRWTIEDITDRIVPLVKEIPMKEMAIDSAVKLISRDYQKEYM